METFIESSGKRLAVLTHPAEPHRGWCLSLHGGGPSSKETTAYLASTFLEAGLSFAAVDFSGQGRSSGHLGDASLEGRLGESLDVCAHWGMTPQFLIGTSMGGYIATKLTEVVKVNHLILFCPAAYSVAAWPKTFAGGFTEEIRRPNSFLETDATEVCGRFEGHVLLVYGARDEVIPPAVQNLYATAFGRARSLTTTVIPDCPHAIHRWLEHRPEAKRAVVASVAEFVKR